MDFILFFLNRFLFNLAMVGLCSMWDLPSSLLHAGSFSYSMQIFPCSMWALVPGPGMEPSPLHWECGVFSLWTTGKSWIWFLKICSRYLGCSCFIVGCDCCCLETWRYVVGTDFFQGTRRISWVLVLRLCFSFINFCLFFHVHFAFCFKD